MIETDMGIIIGIGNVMMNGIEEDLVVGAAQGRLKLQKGVEGQSKTGPSRLPWHEYSSGEACTLVNVALVSLLRMLAGPVATIIMQEKSKYFCCVLYILSGYLFCWLLFYLIACKLFVHVAMFYLLKLLSNTVCISQVIFSLCLEQFKNPYSSWLIFGSYMLLEYFFT